MSFKATAKRAGTAALIAGGTVAAATSGLMHDPAGPMGDAPLTAPDFKSMAVAAGTAAVTAAIVGRRKHFHESAASARDEFPPRYAR